MSDIEFIDEEASGWLADNQPPATRIQRFGDLGGDRRPRLHLLVGDSIARDAGIASRFHGDNFISRARGGETWKSLQERIETDIVAWQMAASAQGLATGIVVVWLTGNDVYSRMSLMSNFNCEILDSVGRAARSVVRQLQRQAEEVLVLEPLPRLAGEVFGAAWETTAAYHLERTTLKMDVGARIITLGRALTRKMGKSRHGLKGCEQWFRPDGVHLSPDGYAKLADAGSFPVWLTMRAAN